MTRRYLRGLSKPRPAGGAKSAIRVLMKGVEKSLARSAVAPGAEVVGALAAANVVVLGVDEYERLLEAADERGAVAAYHRTRGEETVPGEIVDRLMAGENAIRVWREHRSLTLEQLGRAIGKRKGFLSEIESGKKSGSIETLRAIAAALKIDLDDIAPAGVAHG